MEWIKTENRFIAFFDIMGFKNFVNTNSHDKVIKTMEKIASYAKLIDSREFKDVSMLKTAIFSDSIIIISNNDHIESATHLMLSSAFFIERALDLGVPVKGCIAHGKLTADFEKSLFIGQPLIDAFQLQEELFLYSIVLHHSFEAFLIDKEYDKQKFPENNRWIRHLTPFKNGKSRHYHLNWLYYLAEKEEEKVKYKNQLLKFYNTVSGRTRGYVDNTLEFFDKMAELKKSN
jgi:hypothetical protein